MIFVVDLSEVANIKLIWYTTVKNVIKCNFSYPLLEFVRIGIFLSYLIQISLHFREIIEQLFFDFLRSPNPFFMANDFG
jgi:hypothetical protein